MLIRKNETGFTGWETGFFRDEVTRLASTKIKRKFQKCKQRSVIFDESYIGKSFSRSGNDQQRDIRFEGLFLLALVLNYTIWFFIGYWILERAGFLSGPFLFSGFRNPVT
jgi:hypothetical protein